MSAGRGQYRLRRPLNRLSRLLSRNNPPVSSARTAGREKDRCSQYPNLSNRHLRLHSHSSLHDSSTKNADRQAPRLPPR